MFLLLLNEYENIHCKKLLSSQNSESTIESLYVPNTEYNMSVNKI